MSTSTPIGDFFPIGDKIYGPIPISTDIGLRDYFAAQALNGAFSNASLIDSFNAHDLMAKEAYLVADAMMAARIVQS